jgi:hypothetical protein
MVDLLSTLPIIRKRLGLSTLIFRRHYRPPDDFDDLRDDGISEASKAGDAVPQRFIALRLPSSDKHGLEHVVCFFEWFGRNRVPQITHGFIRDASRSAACHFS